MSIKKKVYEGGGGTVGSQLYKWFEVASELLGDDWELGNGLPAAGVLYGGPYLVKNTPNGYYGWVGDNDSSGFGAVIAGSVYNTGISYDHILPNAVGGSITCVVWEGDGGSVGIGNEIVAEGRIRIPLVAAKFNGTDYYALGQQTVNSNNPGTSLFGKGGASIGAGLNMSGNIIGSGVYLHSLFDPTFGGSCSDVLGVQCFDNVAYSRVGTIVKQGGSSYMSALGDGDNHINNILFIKL